MPLKTQSEPKQLVLFDGGHIPPLQVAAPITRKFLDKKPGPVRQGVL